MKIPYVGIGLQFIYLALLLFFNDIRIMIMEQYSVYPIALFELMLGVVSFLLGVYGVVKKINLSLSVLVSFLGIIICFLFVFMYLLPEAGIPPAIPWFYS